ncbi:hypothetical protein D3C87_1751460 [compost metagenome]
MSGDMKENGAERNRRALTTFQHLVEPNSVGQAIHAAGAAKTPGFEEQFNECVQLLFLAEILRHGRTRFVDQLLQLAFDLSGGEITPHGLRYQDHALAQQRGVKFKISNTTHKYPIRKGIFVVASLIIRYKQPNASTNASVRRFWFLVFLPNAT